MKQFIISILETAMFNTYLRVREHQLEHFEETFDKVYQYIDDK
jgi:hypothetical protein